MTDVVVPAPPPLSRLGQVELMHTGTWSASTGVHTFTTGDLANAVTALDCPAVHRPTLKLGHTDPRFDGEPAVGYIDNLGLLDDGHTLVGDYVGMPGWLGPIIASAYPQRSIEGQWSYRCALGHTHDFVLTAVALLGVSHPAIGTLQSLQDVAQLYGVDVAATTGADATPFVIMMEGTLMPQPLSVTATVSTEDVRRAYYDDAPWSYWIEEFSLDPMQLIVIDDDSGDRLRVPVIIGDGDGADGVTFGEPVKVAIRYDDVAPSDDPAQAEQVAASAPILRYASRAESRHGQSAAAAEPAAGGNTNEGGSGVEITNEQLAALRTALGLADDADLEAIIAAVTVLADGLTQIREAVSLGDEADVAAVIKAVASLAAAVPTGEQAAARAAAADSVVQVDKSAFAQLQRDAAAGREARDQQVRESRERTVDNAVASGRIPPARREHYMNLMSMDEQGTSAMLASIPEGTVAPTVELGHSVTHEDGGNDLGWFNTAPTKEA